MNHYDVVRGWENTKIGWHEAIVHMGNDGDVLKKHFEIIDWLKDHVDNYEKHCRWNFRQSDTTMDAKMDVKFRYERDYIWFKLTWG